jgi:hypothetical protein
MLAGGVCEHTAQQAVARRTSQRTIEITSDDQRSIGDYGCGEDGPRLAYRPASRHSMVFDVFERPSAQQRISELAHACFSRCAKGYVRQLHQASQELGLLV